MSSSQPIAARLGVDRLEAPVTVGTLHRVYFGSDFLSAENVTLSNLIEPKPDGPTRALFVLDQSLSTCWPDLEERIREYQAAHADRFTLTKVLELPGGEASKNSSRAYEALLQAINDEGICRQSYVVAMGGGALLDVAGYAASTSHRGVRLIRFPTTTLSQGDSGIGVKNGINKFGKKNFLGAFDVPIAVLNDEKYLTTLSDRDWRAGFSEAVKVALIKDGAFYEEVEKIASRVMERDHDLLMPIVHRSAELHFRHIVEGGDPFERTVARPLDFGHWSAHKIEQMSDFSVLHGEAVATGVALDTLYSATAGHLGMDSAIRACQCLKDMGFSLHHPVMDRHEDLFEGIEEFRQHLGGELAVTLLKGIGEGFTCHEIDLSKMEEALGRLKGFS
ncbi:MAG: 3-dehydroquinate synthase [Candidatus Omnitrophica bacterium]|nr:3-dehydroquinate synthase [Candidatus Omnitrophota bacterium]